MKSWIMVRKGIRFNSILEKRMIVVMGSGLLLGALFHNSLTVFKPVVPYLFAYMTFTMASGCSLKNFKNALRTPLIILTVLGLLHVVFPCFATLLSRTFLAHEPLLQAGIILGTATPIGVAATIWTGISGGDVALALSIVIIDTILSPFIVSLIMLLTIGKAVQFDVVNLLTGLLWMIVIPTILGVWIHEVTKGEVRRKYHFVNGPLTKILLAFIVAVNLSVAWKSLHLLKSAILVIVALTFIISLSGFLAGYTAGKLAKFPPSLVNTMIYTVGIRNITAGLVMAMNYFPQLTAIPVVFATIFQQPLAALNYRFLAEKNKPEKSITE